MPLPPPNLDDRSFEQLLAEAVQKIEQLSPEWTDRSEGDPGMVLLELFAYLTDTMIYRLNRLPDKVYIAFLNLLGVRLQPPAAAGVDLVFSRAAPARGPVRIPQGTRVTTASTNGGGAIRGERQGPVFMTDDEAVIADGETQVTVKAHNYETVAGELAGSGTGVPGLILVARRPPIIAPTGYGPDLRVGVEATQEERDDAIPAIEYDGKTYQIWTEVERFTETDADSYVYVADRATGTIIFAPAARMPDEKSKTGDTLRALAKVPGAGRAIRLWYRRGGGAVGNVAPNTLTTLKDSLAGVTVANTASATGGRAAEMLSNALVRGPQQLYSLDRAVTARDYEMVARRVSGDAGIDRAKAVTRADLWSYASPGTVELLLVPNIPEAERGPGGRVTLDALREHETEVTRGAIQEAVDERRPLGTTSIVNWARYKTASVKARVVVRREEDPTAVKQRMLERLHGAINPLRTQYNSGGWPFGAALRLSLVYDVALKEPGVRWIDEVELRAEPGPGKGTTTIIADPFQPDTWYAGVGEVLYRSVNNGEGWETAGRFAGESIAVVSAHPQRPGLLAVATRLPNGDAGRIHITLDCGEVWQPTPYEIGFHMYDLAWTIRNQVPFLLIASDVGLHELDAQPGGIPVPVLVDTANQQLGFYSVATFTDVSGTTYVALAAENQGGVYLSVQGGVTNTYQHIGLKNEDVRVLEVNRDGPNAYLWAGEASVGDDPGKGCARFPLQRGTQNNAGQWTRYDTSAGWTGGTCWALAFVGSTVLAGTNRAGVLRLDLSAATPKWQQSAEDCGLPRRPRTEPGPFYPMETVAARLDSEDPSQIYIIAGGRDASVYISTDRGKTYGPAANRQFEDKITLPPTWLFVSGEHNISVVSEDEASRD